jgi:hypothetical protein
MMYSAVLLHLSTGSVVLVFYGVQSCCTVLTCTPITQLSTISTVPGRSCSNTWILNHGILQGDISGFYCNKHGVKQVRVHLPEVTVLSDGVFNLISATAMMKRGWTLLGNKSAFSIHKNGVEIVFNIKFSTNKGALYCAYITQEPLDEATALNSNKVMKYNIVKAHQGLGHLGEYQLCKTCATLGFELTKGSLPPCIDCAVGKAWQKNIKNICGTTSDDDEAHKYYFDMASMKNNTARLPNWAMLVHGQTGLKFSNFYAAKNDMVEPMLECFSKLKQKGVPVNVVP